MLLEMATSSSALEQELQEATRARAFLENEIHEVISSRDSLQNELDQLNGTAADLEEQCGIMADANRELKAQVTEKDKQIAELWAQNEQSKLEFDRERGHLSSALLEQTGRADAADEKLQKLREQCGALEDQIRSMTDSTREQEALVAQCQFLTSELTAMRDANDDLHKNLRVVEAEKYEQLEQIEALRMSNKELVSDLSSETDRSSELQARLDEALRQITKTQEECEERTAAVTRLVDELRDQCGELRDRETSLASERDRLQTVANEVEDLRANLREVNLRESEASSALEESRAMAVALQESLHSLESESQERIAALQGLMDEKESEISSLRDELKELNAKSSEVESVLRDELNDAHMQLSDVKSSLAEVSSERDEALAEIAREKSMNQELNEQLSAFKNELVASNSDQEAVSAALASERSTRSSLEARLAEIEPLIESQKGNTPDSRCYVVCLSAVPSNRSTRCKVDFVSRSANRA